MPYKFSVPRPFKDSEEEYLEFPDDVPMEEAVGIADKYYTKQFFNEGLHMAIGGLVKDKISAEDFFTGLGDKAADAMETLNLAVTGKNKYTDPASEFYNPEYNKTQEDAVTEAISLVGLGGRASSVEGGAGTMGTFVGRQAIGKSKAEAFETIEKSGTLSKEQMWEKFGMYRGDDGLLRKEISDSASSIKDDAMNVLFDPKNKTESSRSAQFKLTDLMQHDELFSLYPQMEDVQVRMKVVPGHRGGAFNSTKNTIEVIAPNKKEARSILLHEIQHKIQSIEGFARGGNDEMVDSYLQKTQDKQKEILGRLNSYLYDNLSDDLSTKIMEKASKNPKLTSENYWNIVASEFKNDPKFMDDYKLLLKATDNLKYLDGVKKSKSEMDFYYDLAGELEARNVQTRADWSKGGRQISPPWESEDKLSTGKKVFRGVDPKKSKALEE